jgi:hypothetical protein
MKLMDQSANSPLSGVYYTHDIDDIYDETTNFNDDDLENGTNAEQHSNIKTLDHKPVFIFGLGDFFVFNQMVLFILLPVWPMITKILVVCGCIIAIQLGQCGTAFIHRLWKLDILPGLPMPVITFSIYAMILNVIMEYANNNC